MNDMESNNDYNGDDNNDETYPPRKSWTNIFFVAKLNSDLWTVVIWWWSHTSTYTFDIF